MNYTEMIMRRKNVKAEIDADPIVLVVNREFAPQQNTETGGWLPGSRAALPPQRARIVQNVRRYTDGIVNSEAGDIPKTNYLLLGMHTLDLQVNDDFEWRGENYRVTGIFATRQESILAAVDMRGADNRNGS